MTRALLAVAALACACMIAPPFEQPDSGPPDSGPPPPPVGGGGGGGGGGGDLDGGLGLGQDAGPGVVPGSGKSGDQGTGMLIMVRVDRGTANIADSLSTLVTSWIAAVEAPGFKVSSVAVGDLYTGSMVWATRLGQQPATTLADALRAASSVAAGSPQACTTAGLAAAGRSLSTLVGAGVQPFWPPPGAFLVMLIDTGPRPQAPHGCPNESTFGSDPSAWASFAGRSLPRIATRFAFVSTSESEDPDQMRARCIATSGFPPGAADSLAPSPVVFFGPLSAGLDGMLADLAIGIDACAALGNSDASFRGFVNRWYASLATRH